MESRSSGRTSAAHSSIILSSAIISLMNSNPTAPIRNIIVVGLGYVGLANAVLLSQKYNVTGLDILDEKITSLQAGKSPLEDKELREYLKTSPAKWLNVSSREANSAIATADLAIVATPTNYDDSHDHFDTTLVESAIENILDKNPSATILIKSTIPVGYVDSIREKYDNTNIIFSPEFLREGHALYDNLHPSRVIIGEKSERAREVANLFASCALNDPPILLMDAREAEAVKLFANTYLAMRVAYMNELDTYCRIKGMNTKDVITGMGLDPRIGSHYCNPSFGYGGYCFPKDTKQLKANFHGVPHDLVSAIVSSNKTRKQFIADQILARNPKTVGIYRLTMKSGSDNFRHAAILDIIKVLRGEGIDLIIFEPSMMSDIYDGVRVEHDLGTFKSVADIIVANRPGDELADMRNKVFTSDIFGGDS